MKIPDTTLEIKTLGSFSISVNGKAVRPGWPNEAMKELFCSLLSPLDLYFTWDRICRSTLSIPDTLTGRRQLEELYIRPLNLFLIKEWGFNPIITGHEGIKIDQQRINVDAFEFYSTALEGLRLLSLDNRVAAHEKLVRAKSLYVGCYLPGMPGKIISNTRNDLESLYLTAILDTLPQTQESGFSGLNRGTEPGLHVNTSRRPFQTMKYGHK